MVGSPSEYMKVGLIHCMAYPACAGGEGPITETVASIAHDAFFDVIEVTQIKTPTVRQAVRAIFDESRIEPCFAAQPILLGGKLNLNHAGLEERANAIKAVKEGINQAEELGCSAVAVLSGQDSEDRTEARARLADSLKALCAFAKPKGIRLVLETFDREAFGKNCLIGPTEEAVTVSEKVRAEHPEFGLLLDLSHLPLLHESPRHAIMTAGDHLVHVHIGNCAMDDPKHPAYGDNHPRFGSPGTRVDVPELAAFLRELMDTGYLSQKDRKVVSFEVKPLPGESPASVIAGAKRTLLEAWRRV